MDSIKHPAHYTSHPSGVECITITQHHNFNVGNAIKYLWRAGLKPLPEASAQAAAIVDLRKARQYIDFELKRLGSIEAPVSDGAEMDQIRRLQGVKSFDKA